MHKSSVRKNPQVKTGHSTVAQRRIYQSSSISKDNWTMHQYGESNLTSKIASQERLPTIINAYVLGRHVGDRPTHQKDMQLWLEAVTNWNGHPNVNQPIEA